VTRLKSFSTEALRTTRRAAIILELRRVVAAIDAVLDERILPAAGKGGDY